MVPSTEQERLKQRFVFVCYWKQTNRCWTALGLDFVRLSNTISLVALHNKTANNFHLQWHM